MNSIGLIIGRFQPLHLGHQLLIQTSLDDNPATLILVGSVNKTNYGNPYLYELRKDIITQSYDQKISIGALPDFPLDKDWKDCILSHIPTRVTNVTLYCGDVENDTAVKSLLSFKNLLPFDLKIIEIPRSTIPVSATQIREWIEKKDTAHLKKYLSEKTLLSLGI